MKKLILVMALFAMMTGLLVAQDTNIDTQEITVTINEIALLAVDDLGTVFTFEAPTTAGDAPNVTVSEDIHGYLRYTSLRFGNLTRTVTVAVTDIELANGSHSIGSDVELPIRLSASESPNNQNAPNPGIGKSVKLIISESNTTDLIEGIGPGLSRTGSGSNDGHSLTYGVADDEVVAFIEYFAEYLTDEESILQEQTITLTVTFTLVDL